MNSLYWIVCSQHTWIYKVKINRQNKCWNINICGVEKSHQTDFLEEENEMFISSSVNFFLSLSLSHYLPFFLSLLICSFLFVFISFHYFWTHPDRHHSYVVELLVIFANFEMCVYFEMAYFLTHKMASSQSIFKAANFIRQMLMTATTQKIIFGM